MPTYGGVVDQIISELARADTSLTAVTQQQVLNAVEFYASERFWFNEARLSFTASATIYYPFSTVAPDLLEIEQMTVTVSGGVYEVKPSTYQQINAMDVSGFTGYPVLYATWAEKFRLYPKPNAVYQIDLDYQKRLATLSATSDTNAWTTFGSELIVARAQKVLLAGRFKDPQSASVLAEVEREAFERLKARTEKLLGTGRVTPGY